MFSLTAPTINMSEDLPMAVTIIILIPYHQVGIVYVALYFTMAIVHFPGATKKNTQMLYLH